MSYFRSVCFISVITILSLSSAIAQQDLSLSSGKLLQIRYIQSSWNEDPSKADHGTVVVRNEKTGKILTVQLQESGNNTGIFAGVFRISESESKRFVPQVFIPDTKGSLSNIEIQIEQRKISRKPFFLRKDGENKDVLQIYDRREDAIAEYNAFQNRIKTQQSIAQDTIQAAEVARSAEAQQVRLEKQKTAQTEEERRKELARLEEKKQADLRRKQEALSEQKRREQQLAARKVAAQAMKAYEAEDFAKAQSLFEKSTELDPENNQYSFQYAVTLYQVGEYNKSLVLLEMADGPRVNQAEKAYFQGLNYLKLEDYDEALKSLKKVQATRAPVIGPAAAFYAGVIEFELENLDSAKDSFQYVLDNSQDPKLDEQAETYIEQILQLKQYEEMSKKSFLTNASFGLNYDSNVLLSDNSTPDQGTATDAAGYRALFVGNLAYRPILKPSHDLMVNLGLTNMYTVDSSFQPSEELQAADPLQVSLGVPFTWRTFLGATPYQLALTPSYEVLYMNLDGENNGLDGRELILNSIVLSTDQTFVMSQTYTTGLQFGVRSDDSQTDFVDDADNADALKINLKSSHIFFMNNENTKAWTGDVGYTLNNAEGDNYKFNRYEVGLTYLTPAFWESMATANLSFYQATYPDHASGRKESNYSLNAGLSKPLTESLSSSYQFSYTTNDSNIAGGDYQKITLMALLTWNGLF